MKTSDHSHGEKLVHIFPLIPAVLSRKNLGSPRKRGHREETPMKTASQMTLWKNRRWGFALAILVVLVNVAAAQVHYRVEDLGTLGGGNLGCAMGLNNKGWTEVMDTLLDRRSGKILDRASLRVDGLRIDLGTLGGPNSWTNWGGINECGDAVGYAEAAKPDPNGEDFCFFGTQLTCRPFLWHQGDMRELPTLGGNNGQASAINNRGQIVGTAETTVTDSGCPPYQTAPPVLWEKGKVQQLPTVEGDPDGYALGINELGQVVGGTGTCSGNSHAVLWENGSAIELPNLGNASYNEALAINNQAQIVGLSSSPDGTTFYAALWQNRTIKNLGTLPGDFAALATGINNKGQVVGSTLDSNFNWSHGFIWQDGVMTDLNTLFPADANLYVTMANKVNSDGQISGMATVLSGPHAGDIHAFLATPVNASIASPVTAVATTHPKFTMPANVRTQLLRGLGLGRFGR
jgi:probable HAF family extracellular repeat protein